MSQPRDLKVIHNELLGQFADIIRICDSHEIPYNLMCGSLLGAVRHQGFIPWDDDIDLLMTREAFTRFEKVYNELCDDKYLLCYTNTWTPRVMSKDPSVADVFTDIFILDYLPEGKLQKKIRLLTLKLLQGMLKRNVDYSRFSLPQKVLLFGTHVLGLPFSVETNIAMASYEYMTKFGFLDSSKEAEIAERQIKALAVKTPTAATKVVSLSGGNQQKCIVGRWLERNPKILILDEPTRGIDVGAKFEIYVLMNKIVEQGGAIIMISSELPEVLNMSNRVLTICEGRITGEFNPEIATATEIMDKAIG